MGAGSSFPSCSPLAAASFRVGSRQRRAGQGQKESCKTLANRTRHVPRAMPSPRGLLYRPHSFCKEEWDFVTPIPDLPAALRHKRAERHRDRWYFRCQYAEQHKPALAGELHKKLAGQCRRRNAVCAQAGKARGKPSSMSKTLYLSSARCGKKSPASPPPLRAEGEKGSKNK